MTNTHSRFSDRHACFAALALCLVLRALIPAGYMPGNLLAGELAVLCPEGLPDEVLKALHGGHHGHDQASFDADRACPIGSALLASAPPPADPIVEQYAAGQVTPRRHIAAPVNVAAFPRFRPRAPPAKAV